MAEWKDPRKNIYTVTVVNRRHGYIAHIETHSNKKKAEARLARLGLSLIHISEPTRH